MARVPEVKRQGFAKFMGFAMSSKSEVVEVEPQRRDHERHDNGPMELCVRFEADGGATNRFVDADHDRCSCAWSPAREPALPFDT